MMKLSVVHVKDTKNYVCYETADWEFVFRSGLYGVKLWIPKSEFNVKEGTMPFPIDGAEPHIEGHYDMAGNFIQDPSAYPEVIEIGIMDDTDNQTQDEPYVKIDLLARLGDANRRIQELEDERRRFTGEATLSEIIRRSRG